VLSAVEVTIRLEPHSTAACTLLAFPRMASGSYIGSNDRRLHFGLGDASDPGRIEIHWPSGRKETVKLPAVDRIYTITEGVGITGELCGGKPCAEHGVAGKIAPHVKP
jgi:hypothetical protein